MVTLLLCHTMPAVYLFGADGFQREVVPGVGEDVGRGEPQDAASGGGLPKPANRGGATTRIQYSINVYTLLVVRP